HRPRRRRTASRGLRVGRELRGRCSARGAAAPLVAVYGRWVAAGALPPAQLFSNIASRATPRSSCVEPHDDRPRAASDQAEIALHPGAAALAGAQRLTRGELPDSWTEQRAQILFVRVVHTVELGAALFAVPRHPVQGAGLAPGMDHDPDAARLALVQVWHPRRDP